VYQQYVRTLESLRFQTEREKLIYVLDHTGLTKQEQAQVRRRLTFVENKLLQLYVAKSLN
jgi:hypothetical protein